MDDKSAETMSGLEVAFKEGDVKPERKTLHGWKKWAVITVVGASFVVVGVTFSIPPAFYPSEAEDRGIKPSQYGFVFGISNLSAAIFAIVFALVGQRVGAKWVFVSGSLSQSLAGGILFGTLAYVSSGDTFLILSYVLRFIFGMCDSASFGSSLSLMINLWPDNFSSVFSGVETCFGFGYAVGPYVGSLLYEAGGFETPFFLFGALGLILGFASIFVLPNVKGVKRTKDEEKEKALEKETLTLTKIMKTPLIWYPIFDNLLFMWGYGYIEAMLEPFAKDEAGMTQDQVGLSFLILGTVYMLCAPLVGYLCDAYPKINPALYSIAANAIAFVAFTVLGPGTMISLDPCPSLIFCFMAAFGVASALIQVSTVTRANRAVVAKGYDDNIDNYLILSGSWTFSFYAGNFLGPTIGGFLVDLFDFQVAIFLYLTIYALMFVLDTIQFIVLAIKHR